MYTVFGKQPTKQDKTCAASTLFRISYLVGKNVSCQHNALSSAQIMLLLGENQAQATAVAPVARAAAATVRGATVPGTDAPAATTGHTERPTRTTGRIILMLTAI